MRSRQLQHVIFAKNIILKEYLYDTGMHITPTRKKHSNMEPVFYRLHDSKKYV